MYRMWILLIVVVAQPVLGWAQAESSTTPQSPGAYQPAVPAASNVAAYGGWPDYYHGGASTAAGSALSGMASVISAAGDYNLSTSAAAVNMTQAERNKIQNRQQWTNTYFDMRATNRASRAAEHGPAPTMERLVRMAHHGAPKPLGPSQLDPISGQLDWPGALQQAGFDAQRGQLERIFATRAHYGGLNYADQQYAVQLLDGMYGTLKSRIHEIPPQQYVAGRDFLRSLKYAVSKTELE